MEYPDTIIYSRNHRGFEIKVFKIGFMSSESSQYYRGYICDEGVEHIFEAFDIPLREEAPNFVDELGDKLVNMTGRAITAIDEYIAGTGN